MDNQVDLTGGVSDTSASRNNEDEANLQLLLKKRAQDKRRQVKSYWFEQFPWLELDHERGLFFCRWCIAANRVNTMTRGKSTQMPKKHYFQQHELHGEHQSAALQFWRSVATNSSEMSCPNESELPSNGRECATSSSSISSLRLNVVLPETPTSCPETALVCPETALGCPETALGCLSSIVPSYDHIQNPQTISESYHMPQTASLSQNYMVATPNVSAATMANGSPGASWTQGFDIDARTLGLAVDQTPIITSDLIAGLLDSNVTPKGTRKIKPVWFTVFPWLVLDSARQLFFCQYCCAANRHNIFTEGRTTANPKKDHFYKHALTADHSSAALWYGENTQETGASVSSENSSKHVDEHSEFGSATHGDGGMMLGKVKEEVMSSDEVGDSTMEDNGSQLPRTDTGGDHIDQPHNSLVHHTTMIPSQKQLLNSKAQYIKILPRHHSYLQTASKDDSQDWHCDAPTVAQFLRQFVWLEYSVEGLLKCTACEHVGKQNSFSYGQHPGSVTCKQLVMHERLPGHNHAVCALKRTLEKHTSTQVESAPEVEMKSEIIQDDSRVQPREISADSGGGDVAMETESRSEVKAHGDERRDSVFSDHASVNRNSGTPEEHNRQDWAKMIRANRHGREQISELTNQDILDIVKAFYAEGGTYRTALAYIRELRPTRASEIQLTTFIESVKALDTKRSVQGRAKTDGRELKSFLSRLYKYPKRRKTRPIRRVSTFGMGLRAIGHRAAHFKCQQYRIANVSAGFNPARSTVSLETNMEPAAHGGGHLEELAKCKMPSAADEETINIVVDSDEWIDFFGDVDSRELSNECGTIDSGEKRPLGDLSGVIDKSILQAHPEAVTWMLGAGWGHQAGSRSVQPVWFFEFPWLQYDVSRNRFRCKSCEAHSTVSYFAIVKSGNVPKQHTFVSHEASDRHQVALKAYNADPINKPMSIGMDTTSDATGLLRELRKSPLPVHRKCEPPAQEVTQSPPSPTLAMPVVMATETESLLYHVDQPRIETTQSSWTTNFWQLANQLRHLDILCDVTLTVAPHGGKCEHEFRAHRLMLVCASDLFKTTLSSGKDRFHFEGVSPKGMTAVLDFIYGQPVHGTRSEYVDYYNAATELCVLPARTAFSKVIQDTDNNTRSTNEKQVGSTVVKDSDLNRRNLAKPIKTDAVIQMAEGETRKQSVIGASDQNEPLLPPSNQTRELTKCNVSPSSVSHKIKPACRHPVRISPVGCHSQDTGTLLVASVQNSSGSPRRYKCAKPKCRQKFARRMDLVRHLPSTLTIQKRHRCNWCHKEFVWRSSLLSHEASHVTNVVSVVT